MVGLAFFYLFVVDTGLYHETLAVVVAAVDWMAWVLSVFDVAFYRDDLIALVDVVVVVVVLVLSVFDVGLSLRLQYDDLVGLVVVVVSDLSVWEDDQGVVDLVLHLFGLADWVVLDLFASAFD